MDAIDRGSYAGGPKGRHWALDPIDGTKGFLRGGQYAVCLALIEDGVVQLGVIGCPNLPLNHNEPEGEKGSLFIAVRNQGAYQVRRWFESIRITYVLIHLHIKSEASPMIMKPLFNSQTSLLLNNPHSVNPLKPITLHTEMLKK